MRRTSAIPSSRAPAAPTPDARGAAEIAPLLVPHAGPLEIFEVSTKVNSPANESLD